MNALHAAVVLAPVRCICCGKEGCAVSCGRQRKLLFIFRSVRVHPISIYFLILPRFGNGFLHTDTIYILIKMHIKSWQANKNNKKQSEPELD